MQAGDISPRSLRTRPRLSTNSVADGYLWSFRNMNCAVAPDPRRAEFGRGQTNQSRAGVAVVARSLRHAARTSGKVTGSAQRREQLREAVHECDYREKHAHGRLERALACPEHHQGADARGGDRPRDEQERDGPIDVSDNGVDDGARHRQAADAGERAACGARHRRCCRALSVLPPASSLRQDLPSSRPAPLRCRLAACARQARR